MKLKAKLEKRWIILCENIKANCDPRQFYDYLVKIYSEPYRYYHNLEHIDFCLKHFDEISSICVNPLDAEMAIWLHDIIYNPMSKLNEELSTRIAASILPKAISINVTNLILATKDHNRFTNMDMNIIVDCDLVILGADEELFDNFEQNIRKEFFFVPERSYLLRRHLVLNRFLERKTIYFTDYFRKKYENAARENILRQIKILNQQYLKLYS